MEFFKTFTVTGARVSTAPLNGLTGVVTSVDVECVALTKEFPDAVGRASATVTFPEPDKTGFVTLADTTRTDLLAWANKAAPDQIAQLDQAAVDDFPATIPFLPKG